jgi:hypothetical protein
MKDNAALSTRPPNRTGGRMLANAANLNRAGLLLRALAAGAGWTSGVYVDSRKIAREKAIAGTESELAESLAYMLDQGWLGVDGETDRGEGWFAVTRHGLDESLRKLPGEGKKPSERVA